ncbi:Uncharacterised protein [Mycobacteroides abscessus subsp. abscessus]|nr:hypothetical protein [Mycobacteroides abscessus]SHP09614.1 Uncharacterised protein [Mycobacteroides abscessus subsp. abscessus]SHP23599.1 Uncharacterised protein [Mycobacteroides abscessus subsp. abscessus]SHP94476.1 Uncharacterised protein [Mycobacteroides abscessus subsp. abscessus]SHQ21097.1 Uncharacterised protein [Mycobacteroides abscessus subsp. abscessus]SHQ29910.1 Uncharacterised protein [Mycobacteroides abscessus subsp. abscessus]
MGSVKAAKRTATGTKRTSTGTGQATAGTEPGAGERLRAELEHKEDGPGLTALIRQAARVADRLETLAGINSGVESSWVRLDLRGIVAAAGDNGKNPATVIVEAKIDSTIAEERQQTTLLRHLLAEIHKQRAGSMGSNGGGGAEDDDLDDI